MLPSDIARLILIYLKDEGLTRSYKQFFNESPHLEELRQHPDVEPSVPHEKCLPDILNEYVKMSNAIKDRLGCNQMVNSLWKMHREVIGQLKFQYTGNAGLIQTQTSSQESRVLSQRELTRMRMNNLRKQQDLQRKVAAATSLPTTGPMTVSVATSPEDTQGNGSIMSSYDPSINQVSLVRTRSPSPGLGLAGFGGPGRGQQYSEEVHVVIPEFRTPNKNHSTVCVQQDAPTGKNHSTVSVQQDAPTGKSPKRKSAAPRRKPVTMTTTISPRPDNPTTSSSVLVAQWEEEIRDLPQVLETLLNNTAFQEKLAGNINKALPGENRSEPARELEGTSTTDGQSSPSIEEVLNLHMNEETIQEIVQSTSKDPAFESLVALFNMDKENFSQESNASYLLPSQTDQTDTRTPSLPCDDIITGKSQLPTTPLSNQSHSPSDQVTPARTNHNVPVTASVCVTAVVSSTTTSANTPLITTSTGQLNVTTCTTGPMTNQFTLNQSSDGVMTLPVVLSSPGQYQILQPAMTNPASPQNTTMNSILSRPSGTIFMAPDGRILGTSNVLLQNGQPLQARGVIQNVAVGQASTPEVTLTQGEVRYVAQNDTCPVHGRKASNALLPTSDEIGTPPLAVTSASPIAASSVTQLQNTSEVLQLLGTMVESDVGSLFSVSPEKPPSSSKRPFHGVGSNTKPSIKSSKMHKTAQEKGTLDKNQNNNHATKSPSQNLGDIVTATQMTTPTRNVFSAINSLNSEGQVANLTLTETVLDPQTSLQTSAPTEVAPPLPLSKQRKSIQFKGPVHSRNLDFGTPCEITTKTGSKRQGTKASKQTTAKCSATSKTPISRTKSSQESQQRQHSDSLVTTLPANRHAAHYTPEKVAANSDMSAEVNIAAQMLVCLSNSPPSLRQSPYRLQRRRNNSGHSPVKSPTQDYVTELRKEIGLTLKSRHPPEKDTNFTPPATTNEADLLLVQNGTSSRDASHTGRAKSTSATNIKDVKSSKRKSRTPRKQMETSTETVVVALPSESHQKSKKTPPTAKQKSPAKMRATLPKANKSPGKVAGGGSGVGVAATRKSSRNIKSPGKLGGDGEWITARGANEKGNNSPGKNKSYLKRSHESASKEEEIQGNKKPKMTKNPKKNKKSHGFPSNMDVDKFLSSLQYAE